MTNRFNLNREAAPLATRVHSGHGLLKVRFNLNREAAPLATWLNAVIAFDSIKVSISTEKPLH